MINRRRTGLAGLTLCVMLAVGLSMDTPSSAQQFNTTQRYRGFIAPSRQVELASPIEETLRLLEVREGDRVEQGQVLAALDDALQVVIVEAARLRAASEAAVQSTALELERARKDEQRMRDAFNRGAATDVEVDHARIAALQAEAAHQEALEKRALARVNLQLEEQRLARYRVRAPFDGTVVRLIAESGAMLTSEDAILLLADLQTLDAHVNLPATLYGQLDVGRTYTLRAEQPVRAELTGVLTFVNPVIDTASQTFACVLEIDNRRDNLPAGFTVSLAWPPTQTATVPE